MAGDLAALLRAAREKAAAESAVDAQRQVLRSLDTEIVELEARCDAARQQVAKASSPLGRLRPGASEGRAIAAAELERFETAFETMKGRLATGKAEFRQLEQDAAGAELARAKLSAEMARLTDRLGSDHPARRRLAEIDDERSVLVERLRAAIGVSAIAVEVLPMVGEAERADDGTDHMFVQVDISSAAHDRAASFLQPNALLARMRLKDRIDSFRAVYGGVLAYPALDEISRLVVEDITVDHEVWLHRVREALKDAAQAGAEDQVVLREQLVALDDERIRLLSG